MSDLPPRTELVIPNMLVEGIPLARFEAVTGRAGEIKSWHIDGYTSMPHDSHLYPSRFALNTRISVPMPRGSRVAALVKTATEPNHRYAIAFTECEPIMPICDYCKQSDVHAPGCIHEPVRPVTADDERSNAELAAQLDAELARLNAELDDLTPRMLDACERYTTERTAEAFKAWTTINAEYVEKHRRWWALVSDVDYDNLFGVR